jgi:hypothetical protein
MVATGVVGSEAVHAWIVPRADEVERIRTAVHGIASSGLTLSKLSVAASLLGDITKEVDSPRDPELSDASETLQALREQLASANRGLEDTLRNLDARVLN